MTILEAARFHLENPSPNVMVVTRDGWFSFTVPGPLWDDWRIATLADVEEAEA